MCVLKKRAGFCPPGLGLNIPPSPPWGGWRRGAPGRPAARGHVFVPRPWVFRGFPADMTRLTLCRWIYLQMVFKPNTFKIPSAWSTLGGGARSQGWGVHPCRDAPAPTAPFGAGMPAVRSGQRCRVPAASSPLAGHPPLWGNHFPGVRTGIVQVVLKVFVAPRQLLTVPFAQSRPSCGLSTNRFAYDCLMAKARPTQGVYFSPELAGGWLEGRERIERPPQSL